MNILPTIRLVLILSGFTWMTGCVEHTIPPTFAYVPTTQATQSRASGLVQLKVTDPRGAKVYSTMTDGTTSKSLNESELPESSSARQVLTEAFTNALRFAGYQLGEAGPMLGIEVRTFYIAWDTSSEGAKANCYVSFAASVPSRDGLSGARTFSAETTFNVPKSEWDPARESRISTLHQYHLSQTMSQAIDRCLSDEGIKKGLKSN